MLVSKIKWDCDGEDPKDYDLPEEVEVDDDLDDDEIADYLSDEYGWCVESFSLPMTDEDVDEFGYFVNEVEGKVS